MAQRLKWLASWMAVLAFGGIATSAQSNARSKRAASSKAGHQVIVDPAVAAAAKKFVATGCEASLWDHVYHPQRLQVVEACISVSGTIHHIKQEADGDDHIQLKLDSDYASLINDRNMAAQAGCLVLEPICQNAVIQRDAQAACRDFHSAVDLPAKGTHVRVFGSYVLDAENPEHGWMEIHPVTSIEVTP
jgi:hypothetical protein